MCQQPTLAPRLFRPQLSSGQRGRGQRACRRILSPGSCFMQDVTSCQMQPPTCERIAVPAVMTSQRRGRRRAGSLKACVPWRALCSALWTLAAAQVWPTSAQWQVPHVSALLLVICGGLCTLGTWFQLLGLEPPSEGREVVPMLGAPPPQIRPLWERLNAGPTVVLKSMAGSSLDLGEVKTQGLHRMVGNQSPEFTERSTRPSSL